MIRVLFLVYMAGIFRTLRNYPNGINSYAPGVITFMYKIEICHAFQIFSFFYCHVEMVYYDFTTIRCVVHKILSIELSPRFHDRSNFFCHLILYAD